MVDDGFEVDLGAATIADVLGENGDALGVVDAVDDGLGGEPAEDDGVDGSDAGAGEQRDGELGAHAHVDGDAVALCYAAGFEDVGEALDMVVEIGVGEAADFAGLALPEDCDFVAERAGGVSVDAVVGEVEPAAVEPGGGTHVPFEHGVEGGEPVELGGGFAPEGIGVFYAALIHGFVLGHGGDAGFGGELRRRREDAVFAEKRFHVGVELFAEDGGDAGDAGQGGSPDVSERGPQKKGTLWRWARAIRGACRACRAW